jgi:MATE family multidrug resistance protein
MPTTTMLKPHSIRAEIKDTIATSVPLVSSQIVYASSGFLGTAMVAQLGEDALAASVLVSMAWMCLSVLFFGLLNSVSVLVSHQYGANNHEAISKIMGQSFILGLIVTLLLIASMFFMPFLLSFSDQPAHVLKLATAYSHSLIWEIPALVLLIILEQFLAGINRAKIVLRISLIVVPLEIPLIYVLIFGKFGMPECGIAGIGYGFATTYTLTLIFLTWYFCRAKQFKPFGLFSRVTTFNRQYFSELVNVGLPMGFMHVIEICAFTIMTFWIARFGTTTLAAHQIVLQYLWFAITLVFAMSQAVTVRVGYSVGREDVVAVQYASYVGMCMNFICVLIVALFFYFIPEFFLRLDIDVNSAANAALVHDASKLLCISAVLLIFDNFRIIGFGALRGLKDTRFPMYASVLSFWAIGLSAAYVFGFVMHGGGEGIWWGLTLGIAVGALMVLHRMHKILKTVNLASIKSIGQQH